MKDYLKRIILDIKNIMKEPIEGIYYEPDADDISKGYAMIIGPKDTPYQYGYYFFEFNFPDNYPFQPPHVVYKTNDGIVRFNPNFYKSGKVCLSILNTWPGERWSSCQTLRSVLITLQMTMNENPLLNEPGINEVNHSNSIDIYNQIIYYKNIDFSILEYLKNTEKIPIKFSIFEENMKEEFIKNKNMILQHINNNIDKKGNLYSNIYSMNINYNYNNLMDKYNSVILKNKIELK